MYLTDRVFLQTVVVLGIPMRSLSKYSKMPVGGLGNSIRELDSRDDDFWYPQERAYLEGRAVLDATYRHRRTRSKRQTDDKSSTDEDYNCNNQEFPTVGAVRKWPAHDAFFEADYVQNYELRVIAENIEIWVALDLAYPNPDDCLPTPEITDEQLNGFSTTFDNIMYPIMSNSFSVPLYRDGAMMDLSFFEPFNLSACSFYGEGSRIVALIENVRDENFYDPSTELYVSGYFSPELTALTNRNVMTIDSFDWIFHTANLSSFNACVPEGFVVNPYEVEEVFVHEYSHLLIYSIGYKELWVDEGLAEYATSVVGYYNTSGDPGDQTFLRSLKTFLGFETYGRGGPEQSLTRWEEQGWEEVVGDYGSAHAFFLYLEGQLGAQILKEFYNNPYAAGLVGLQSVLDLNGFNSTVNDLMQDWLVALAVTGEITKGALVNGEAIHQSHPFAIPRIPLSKINWTNPECYDKPGVPTNGADFVRLRGDQGNAYLSADRISSIEFVGSPFYPLRPLEWIETNTSTLYSGKGDMLDRSLLRQIDVPVTGIISVELEWDIESGYDFFFLQVYDEAEGKWVSLASQNTTYETFDGLPKFFPSLPGLTGSTGGEILEQFYQAQAYAGTTVYISLRYCTDSSTSNDGVTLYGLTLDDSFVSDATNLTSWQAMTDIFPIPVDWHISLVAYTPGGSSVWARHLALDDHQLLMNDTDTLKEYIGSDATIVAALVSAFDLTETVFEFATYELYVNGILQPGGGM